MSESIDLSQPSPACDGWTLRSRSLDFGREPRLMGIINVTPDSFSDGGNFFSAQAAVDHGLLLEDQGADVLDIGGESTRPYSDPVEAEEELRRVIPVVQALAGRTALPISIDTSKSVVAQAAIEAGAEIINDVTGLEGDPRMAAVAAQSGVGVCAMHMRGSPQTMQDDPRYTDVARDILDYLVRRRDDLLASGIARNRICLDPGIGFGKTHQHNLTLLANCRRFHEAGCPLLVGHSRKGFIGKLLRDKDADRTYGSVGVTLALAAQHVQLIRVHDVAANRQALALFAAAGGIDGVAGTI